MSRNQGGWLRPSALLADAHGDLLCGMESGECVVFHVETGLLSAAA